MGKEGLLELTCAAPEIKMPLDLVAILQVRCLVCV